MNPAVVYRIYFVKYVTNFVPTSDRDMILQLSGHPLQINTIQINAPDSREKIFSCETFCKVHKATT